MELALTPDQERLLQSKVAAGLYSSPSDAIDQALRLLEDRDRLDALRLEELRREIADGLADSAAGRTAPLDMEAVRAKVAERLARRSEGG